MPIRKRSGENREEFLERCIPIEISTGKTQEQSVAICINIWEEKQLSAVKRIRSSKKKDLMEFRKETIHFESYDDYPKAATENAKIALRWAEKNGWGSCGTPVGKIRANQLANGEKISRDTIARMAAFERHRQNSQKELGDGCGRLMWLAWGGDEGVEWAQRKLKQIEELMEFRKERTFVDSTNADRIMYDTDTLELTIQFQDGSKYTYFDVNEELYLNVVDGNASTRTAGEWGPIGKSPSVGAAIHQYLIERNIRYEKGGSFR